MNIRFNLSQEKKDHPISEVTKPRKKKLYQEKIF